MITSNQKIDLTRCFVSGEPTEYPYLQVIDSSLPPTYTAPGGPKAITEISLSEGAGEKFDSFPIIRASELVGARLSADFVERLLGDGAASLWFGPSNTGKSFIILDLCICVASGRAFRDEHEVDQGAVVYVAGEGITGMQNRIEAARREGMLPSEAPLFLCFVPVSLLEPSNALKLAESVKAAAEQSNLPCRLVVIDTLSRSMPGGDENSGKDMTVAVQSIDAVRAATGAHVLAVHHTGKDQERGARGHSSLRAAVDTEVEITRPEGSEISTARITKQRDLPMGGPMPFSLKVVTLGLDRRGKPVTSCVVKHEDEMMAPNRSKAGRKNEVSNNDLIRLLPRPSTADWLKAATEETGISKTAFYRQLKELRKTTIAQTQAQGWILAIGPEIPKYSRN
jgi:AAA domain